MPPVNQNVQQRGGVATAPRSSKTLQPDSGVVTGERYIYLVLLLAVALYLFNLAGNGLWLDEFSSIQDAQALPGRFDPTRPLYYIVLRVWMLLGTGERWLRGLSVLFGLGSVWMAYRLGRRVAGVAVGLTTAVLLACSPLMLNHVQEVRMYPLGNFLVLLGSLFLLQALDRPTTASMLRWSIVRMLATLTIPLSILLWPADVIVIVITFRQRWVTIVRFALSMALAGLLLVPSAIAMVRRAGPGFVSDWAAGQADPGLASIVAKLTSFTVFWPLASLPQSLIIKGFYYAFTLLLAVLLAMGLVRIKRQVELRWVTLWAFVPAALMLLFSYLSSPIWTGRYLLFLSPFVMLLLAVGFDQLRQRYRMGAIALCLIYALALGGGWHQYYTNWDRDGWREAVEDIQRQEMAGDTIAVYAPLKDPRLAVDYYYEGGAIVHPIGPFAGKVSDAEVSRVLDDIPKPEAAQRMWIVFRKFNSNREANKLVAEGITNKYNIISEQRFPGPITLFLVRSAS